MKRPAKQPTRARNRFPSDLAGLLRRAFPDGVVELPADVDEIDLDAAYPGLKQALAAIDGAVLLYERAPDGRPLWNDEADPSDDPPSDFEHDRSYLLMFLALKDERFRYEAKDLIEDEQGTTRVQGTGRIGCTVAISVLASMALVKFDDMEQLEDGSEILPQVEDRIFDLDWNPVDLESHFRSTMGDEATQALKTLADRIATILAAHGIRVLSKHELAMAVPWLRAGEETLIGGDPGATVTVGDAFFFEQL